MFFPHRAAAPTLPANWGRQRTMEMWVVFDCIFFLASVFYCRIQNDPKLKANVLLNRFLVKRFRIIIKELSLPTLSSPKGPS